MSMPQPSMPTPTNRRMRRQQMLSTLTDTVSATSIDASVSIRSIETTDPAAAITATPTTGAADQPDAHDSALLVGLSIWTARQHERYVAAANERGDGRPLHSYPAVLVATLRRHADAGDPTCRLVLDWLTARRLTKTGTGSPSNEGAV